MTQDLLARTPDDVSPRWLTAALRRAGALRDAQITDIAAKRVGNGMLGDSVQFRLTYDRAEDGAPASVVGKFASTDPVSKATGASVGLYAKEVNFYRELRDTVAIRSPHPYVAEIDPATQDFTLILEDMAPARGGDQLTGCSLEDAERAMDQAAALHGPRWGDPTLLTLPWLMPKEGLGEYLVNGFPGFLAAFRERYDDMLEPEYMAECHRLGDQIGEMFTPRAVPPTAQHTDYRLDNMLFDANGGTTPLVVLDWQSVGIGSGMLDVAYFIGAGLLADARQAHEEMLVQRYLEALKGYGVTGYDGEAAWRDYRIGILQGVFTSVFASVGTVRTERGDQMFMTMARRHCQHAIDLESLKVLHATVG
jgi:hypothetical protein